MRWLYTGHPLLCGVSGCRRLHTWTRPEPDMRGRCVVHKTQWETVPVLVTDEWSEWPGSFKAHCDRERESQLQTAMRRTA
jgi:hypothetical protein